MRSVTVRVSEAGDWQFRAELTNGQPLFELTFTGDESDAVDTVLQTSPPSAPPAAADLPYHLGDFGMMLGAPNDDWNTELFNLRDAVDLALPSHRGARVAEIGAGSLETTVAYARDWEGAELFVIDPDLMAFNSRHEFAHTCRKHNLQYLDLSGLIEANAVDAAEKVDKQDLALLIISPALLRAEQVKLLQGWMKHLLPSGRVILRMPTDKQPLSIPKYESHQAGEWLLYSPVTAAKEGDNE